MEEKALNENKTPTESKQPKPKKKSGFMKYVLNIVLVLLVTTITVGITIGSDAPTFIKSISTLKWEWIAAAIGCVCAAFLVRSLIYLCFARLYTRKYHLHQALAVDQIGIFYSAVTPGATGGQFMQAYTYKKQGLPISAGASIMVMSSIVYQMMLVLYGILAISVKHEVLANIPPFKIGFGDTDFYIPVIPLIIAGFILNMTMIGILLLMSYWKKFHHFVLGPVMSFLAMIHLVKDKDTAVENLRVQVENFKIELRRLLSNIPFTILISVLYFFVLSFLFAVPFFVSKALGSDVQLTWDGIWTSIFMSNFHQMVTGLIPIPGSAGVSELFFYQLFDKEFFGPVNGVSTTAAGQLIWRTLTFTLPLIVSGLVSAFYRGSPKEEIGRRELNHATFVNLQRETQIERNKSMEQVYETNRLTRQAIMSSLKLRDKKEREEAKKKREEEKKRQRESMPIDTTEGWNEMNIGDDDDED